MTSEVSICNQALSLLGAQPITSLDDDTNEAKLCKLNYDNLRDTVLEAHDWTFAIRWMDLTKSADPPASEFANAYPLPGDVLRVIFAGQGYRYPIQYQVEGNHVVTDDSACRIQAIVRVTDVSQYSPLFVQALVTRIAAELAIPITNSRTLMETHVALYERKVQEAATRDGQQSNSRRIRSRWLQASRQRGSPYAGPYV